VSIERCTTLLNKQRPLGLAGGEVPHELLSLRGVRAPAGDREVLTAEDRPVARELADVDVGSGGGVLRGRRGQGPASDGPRAQHRHLALT
jgi:hypothetical protein